MNTYDFQPGNATRYDLLYGRLPDGRLLLCWLSKGGSGGTAFRFHPDSFIASDYLSEKMGCNEADADALTAFLRSKGHDAR